MEKIDSHIVELLASRLCHEFSGPLGAVANGIELIAESNDAVAKEALGMASASAQELSNRLKFYRLAYGFAGAGANNLAEIRELALAFYGNGAAHLVWPMPFMPPGLADGEGKLLLNMLALARTALPKGGQVTVSHGAARLAVKVEGADAGLTEDLVEALSPAAEPAMLTSRNIHGFWTRYLARRVGRDLAYEISGREAILIAAST